MNIARQFTKPLRFIRARARRRALGRQHRAEVAQGANLEARADRTPIFIIGSPRSGTTLLYQLLTEQFDVGYLTNVHAEHPGKVSRIEREQRPRAQREASDFESEHGETRGAAGPHEAGEFWYRFFPRDQHEVDEDDSVPQRLRGIRAAVRLFADACGAPVIFKNTLNSLRVAVIADALPEARFILIERDLTDNARSLLAGRLKRGDLDAWWSAAPIGHVPISANRTPAEQVVWQARQVNLVARRQLARMPKERSFTLAYTDLCADPQHVVREIHEWLTSTGAQIELRADASAPEAFGVRSGAPLPDDLEQQLQDAVQAITTRGGVRV